jgi:hypothetical protein
MEVDFLISCCLGGEWVSIGCCQGIEKLLVRWGEAVVDVVVGCPDCIYVLDVSSLPGLKIEDIPPPLLGSSASFKIAKPGAAVPKEISECQPFVRNFCFSYCSFF